MKYGNILSSHFIQFSYSQTNLIKIDVNIIKKRKKSFYSVPSHLAGISLWYGKNIFHFQLTHHILV